MKPRTDADAEWLRSVLDNEAVERAWIESITTRLEMAVQSRIDYLDGKATHEEVANAYKAVGVVGRQMGLIHEALDISRQRVATDSQTGSKEERQD